MGGENKGSWGKANRETALIIAVRNGPAHQLVARCECDGPGILLGIGMSLLWVLFRHTMGASNAPSIVTPSD